MLNFSLANFSKLDNEAIIRPKPLLLQEKNLCSKDQTLVLVS